MTLGYRSGCKTKETNMVSIPTIFPPRGGSGSRVSTTATRLLQTAPYHKHGRAQHREGTLVLLCGEGSGKKRWQEQMKKLRTEGVIDVSRLCQA